MTSYLSALYDGLTTSYWGYLWTTPGERSHWFRVPDDLPAAETKALELSEQGLQVYWGFGLGTEPRGPSGRLTKPLVAAIPGVWVDLDYDDPAHRKPNLPPTREDALRLATELAPDMPPSIVIHSGHGLYALWLFREVWEIADAQERAQAQWMVEGWQKAIRARARDRKWDVDSTGNLDRVYRMPGTWNRKNPDALVMCEIMDVGIDLRDVPRYNPGDFEARLIDVDVRLTGNVPSVDLGDGWQPRAMGLKHDKFNTLMSEHELFRASWYHKRTDFQDQSLSTYDMSLAGIAAKAAWTDEEIADLIAEHRSGAGDTKRRSAKAFQQYVQRTIGVARRNQRIESIEAGETEAESADPPLDRARARWQALGVPDVIDWYYVPGDRNEFVLTAVGGELRISASDFATYSATAGLIVTHVDDALLTEMKQPAWLRHVSYLKKLAEPRGEQFSVVDMLIEQFRGFAARAGMVMTECDVDKRRYALTTEQKILMWEGRYWFRAPAFLAYLKSQEGEGTLGLEELRKRWSRTPGKVNQALATEGSAIKCWTLGVSVLAG